MKIRIHRKRAQIKQAIWLALVLAYELAADADYEERHESYFCG